MAFVVREGRAGDLGGGHKPGNNWHKMMSGSEKSPKTINDNKSGFKMKSDGSNKKYGKGGNKKDAEQKPRKPFNSYIDSP